MYAAELKGKLSSRLERKEDILTSNVFSFFKYAHRQTFLKSLLEAIGLRANDADLESAEFRFWPRYADDTEPDVVVTVGEYYLLFEAKYFSGFGEETTRTRAQLVREIEGGLKESEDLGKTFLLVAVTSAYCFDATKFASVPETHRPLLRWVNWQTVARILLDLIEAQRGELPDLLFAHDLLELLEKKDLRGFRSFDHLKMLSIGSNAESVFLLRETVSFRGDFIGFESLDDVAVIGSAPGPLFCRRTFFDGLGALDSAHVGHIFFKRR